MAEKKTTKGQAAKPKTSTQQKAAVNKGGRPSKYTVELAAKIIVRVAEGESMRTICRDEEMPRMSTIFAWLRDNKEFSEQYTRAKQEAADALSEDIQEIGKLTLTGLYEPAAARVAIDSYKWIAAKLKPKKYGDKVDITTDGEKLGVSLSAEQAERLIRARAERGDSQGDSK